MLKVMISQPMNGKTEEQIRSERERVVTDLTEQGYEVIDTIVQEEPDKSYVSVPVYYLAKSVEFMSKVDVIYFMDGWKDARGCKIEHEIALRYGLNIIEEFIPRPRYPHMVKCSAFDGSKAVGE